MSPFKSEAQRRWMEANHPEMAKRWEAEMPDNARLPERIRHDEPTPKKRRPPKGWRKL